MSDTKRRLLCLLTAVATAKVCVYKNFKKHSVYYSSFTRGTDVLCYSIYASNWLAAVPAMCVNSHCLSYFYHATLQLHVMQRTSDMTVISSA